MEQDESCRWRQNVAFRGQLLRGNMFERNTEKARRDAMSSFRQSSSKEVHDSSKDPEPVSLKQQQSEVASTLAYIFSASLLLMFLLNFATVTWLSHGLGPKESLEAVTRVFSTWIPIMLAYVASAVSFYFPRNRR
jgi:hypothetical protein